MFPLHKTSYRTSACADLTEQDTECAVVLVGWVHRKRDHGQLIFIDLRDHYGLIQCVFSPDVACFKHAEHLKNESVIQIKGNVVLRSQDTINSLLPTGRIEIAVNDVKVLSESRGLPFPINQDLDCPEDIRLTHRFLDLRREKIHKNIILRSNVIASMRRRMIERGFLEIQTPILTASSPEGARDFLVPSRLHHGKFYALPQAPQQFKQLLMVAGFDKYFQIAPCFRDEDARADRSPGEFYQLDCEMSFVTQDDVFAEIEPVLHGIFDEFAGDNAVSPQPFRRIPFEEAMLKYGSDKPDLRNPLIICDVSNVFEESGFTAFAEIVKSKGVVRAINIPGGAAQPRSFFDKLNAWAREIGLPGVGYIIREESGNDAGAVAGAGAGASAVAGAGAGAVAGAGAGAGAVAGAGAGAEAGAGAVAEAGAGTEAVAGTVAGAGAGVVTGAIAGAGSIKAGAKGPIAKFLSEKELDGLFRKAQTLPGDAVCFVADKNSAHAAKNAGYVRTKVANTLNLINQHTFELCWVVDFPMYERDEISGQIIFSHNPFSMPQGGMEALLTKHPLNINAYQYDIVCNGVELSSGAIRNHEPETLYKAFEIAGYTRDMVDEKFSGMINAFRFGAPPHGGCAPGIDRIVMLLSNEQNIREVIAFPFNQQAQDLMMRAPSEVTAHQLRELHIATLPKKAGGK